MKRQIAYLAVASTLVLALAGCGGGDEVESAAPATPQRTGGGRPKSSVATGPMPEALKKKFNMPPSSPNAAKRDMATRVGSGRSPETEARKLD